MSHSHNRHPPFPVLNEEQFDGAASPLRISPSAAHITINRPINISRSQIRRRKIDLISLRSNVDEVRGDIGRSVFPGSGTETWDENR